MKQMIRKIFIIALMVFSLIASAFFAYKSYYNYKSNQIIQKSDLYLSLIDQIDALIRNIDHERLLSALYLGFDGKTDFRQLEETRQKSDLILSDINDFLKKNPDITFLENFQKNLTSNLQYVRSRVDVVSADYQDIIFKYYQHEVIDPMLLSVKDITQKLSQGISSYHLVLQNYAILQDKEDSLRLEESFISFVLGRSFKVSMPDLVLYNGILEKNSKPFDHISEISQEQSNQLEDKLKELRISVIKGVSSGNYAISVTSWIANMDALIQNITLAQQNAYQKLQNIDFKSVSSENVISSILICIIFLLVFIGLFFLLRYKKELPNPKSDNPNIQIKKDTTIDKLEVKPMKNKQKPNTSKLKEKPKPKPMVEVNENIVLKNPITNLENDLPLSNMRSAISEEVSPNYVSKRDEIFFQPEILKREDKTFYALEEFKMIIKPFITEADAKNVDFHYDIDPAIPVICVGDIVKIKEFLAIFLSYAIKVTPSKGLVVLKIENIAQKKFESAINFTIEDSGRYIDEDERRKIKRGVATHHVFLPDTLTNDSQKEDLSFASRLVFLLDGRLTISSEQNKGSTFSITLNLKKFITTDD